MTRGGPDPNAPLTSNDGILVRFKVDGRDHGLDIEVIVELNGEGIITGYLKNDGGIMSIKAVDKFIEYIEGMILLSEGEFVRDSRGCYPKDEFIESIVADAKELIKYGEAMIAMENILENLNEVSISIDKEAAKLVEQAFGEKYSDKIERILSALIK